MTIISTVTHLTVADGAIDAGIDNSIQGESCLTATANTSKGIAVAAIQGTRGVTVSIIDINSISCGTITAQTARIAGLAIADGANDTVIVDEGVEVVAGLANIGSNTQLAAADIARHARSIGAVAVQGKSRQALAAYVIEHA